MPEEFEPLGVRMSDELVLGRAVRALRRIRRLELRLEIAKLKADFWSREWQVRRKRIEAARKVAPIHTQEVE